MRKENKLGVALVKELCLICTKEKDGQIIMNKKLTEKNAKKVETLNNKVIGFSKEPCTECKKIVEKAFIFIGFDEKKSDMKNLPRGFYRTGHIIGTKKDIPLVQEWVKKQIPGAIEKGFCFIPHIIMKKLGLIKNIEYGNKQEN